MPNILATQPPNKAVLANDEYTFKDNEILYPKKENVPETQYFHNLPPETLMLMTSLWDNLKIEGNDDASIYIGLCSFCAVVVAYAIYRTVRKKKRERMY